LNLGAPQPPKERPSWTSSSTAKWLPVGAAAAVIAVVVAAGVSGSGNGSASGSLGSVDVSLTVPPSTAAPVVVTEATVPKTQLDAPLSEGMSGESVRRVQTRLKELGFDPGPVDGVFGTGTKQAVWAYEKLTNPAIRYDAVSGTVTNELWQTMQDNVTFPARRPGGAGTTHMEIYLDRQVAIVYTDDAARLITHISTGELNADGSPKTWCEDVTYDTDAKGEALPEPVTKPMCAESKTPGGVFEFYRRYEGTRNGPLGSMWNPVYFNYGIAVHGARNVPDAPASHGCVRIPMFISEYFPDLVANGDLVYVWDGKKEPEQQSKNDMLPSFDRLDPTRTTTTTTSTNTTTTTTTTPVTAPATVPPTPTASPAPAPAPTPAATTSSVAPPPTTVAAPPVT
jgi:peptidoglycan hydrolase-like protein with peptidoglycan-binding domain